MSGEETRAELVRAALHIVAKKGAEALTLRQLGASVGVSRQAPYFYFPDKTALLAAVAAEGMRRERKRIEKALAATSAAPRARLHAIARGHLAFLDKQPRLYALVYGRTVHKSDSRELQDEAIATFALLREAVAACCPGAGIAVLRRRCIATWAVVRGIGELHAQRQVPASVEGSPSEWVEDAVDAMLDGWLARTAAAERS